METNKSSLLENISIASPCKADWNKMTGDDYSRFCTQCQLQVYNLSNMTGQEAERLIEEKEGKLCKRFYRRIDGKILTQDCPIGLKIIEKTRRIAILTAAALAFMFGLYTIGNWILIQIQHPFMGS